jgi:cell division protein FtsL
MKKCHKCGENIDSADMFCKNCGEKQNTEQSAQPEQSVNNAVSEVKKSGFSEQDKKVLLILVGVILFIFFITIASCGYGIFKMKRKVASLRAKAESYQSVDKEEDAEEESKKNKKSRKEKEIMEQKEVKQMMKAILPKEEIARARESYWETIAGLDAQIAEAKAIVDELYDYLPENIKKAKFVSDEEAVNFASEEVKKYTESYTARMTSGDYSEPSEKEQKEFQAVVAMSQYYAGKIAKRNYEAIYGALLE